MTEKDRTTQRVQRTRTVFTNFTLLLQQGRQNAAFVGDDEEKTTDFQGSNVNSHKKVTI